MAYVIINPTQTDKKSPVDDQLMDTIREDLDDLDARVTAGGSGSGSGIDALAEKAEQEHYKVYTDRFPNSLHESFSKTLSPIEYFLLKALSTTTIHAALNPVHLESTNKNTDGTTGWVVFGDASSITTDATNHAIGSNMPAWSKAGGTDVLSGLSIDLTAALAVQAAANTKLLFQAYFPNTTNLIKAHVRLSSGADVTTNYRDIEVTVDSDGAAFATGLNLLEFDLTTGTETGTGWDYTDPIRSFAIIYEYSSAAQTVSGLAFDAIAFSLTLYDDFVRKGMQLSINDNTNVETITIAHNSAKVYAHMTLAAAPASSYVGGSTTRARRNTLTIAGDNTAKMEDGLSGNVAKTQTVRISRILPEALSSNTLAMIVSQMPQNVFTVSAVDSSTQIKVTDAGNLGLAQFKSADKFYVFKPHKVFGRVDYEYRLLELTLSADSTYSAPDLTLQTGTNTGVVIGDTIIKRDIVVYLNTIAATGANEAPGTALNPTKLYLEDIGTPYSSIGGQFLYGHWMLGGTDGLKNLYGKAPDLSEQGGPVNKFRDFMNGLFGVGAFASTGRLYLPIGSADELLGDSGLGTGSISFSFWFKPIAAGDSGVILSHCTTNSSGNSWIMYYAASGGGEITVYSSGANLRLTVPNSALPTGNWLHVAVVWDDTVELRVYVNATKYTGTAPVHVGDATNSMFALGNDQSAANPLTAAYMTDLKAWSGYLLTDANVATLYQNGVGGGRFGKRGYFNQYFEKAAQSGQWITGQVDAIRRSDAINNLQAKLGIIKK